jgi:hypothetical protein
MHQQLSQKEASLLAKVHNCFNQQIEDNILQDSARGLPLL